MVGRLTGVTKSTAKRLMIDSGVVFLNYGENDERILGATEDGVSFVLEQEIREPEIDGLPGPLAGTRRVVAVHARITANLLEQTTENILLEIAGAESEVDDDYDVITRKGYRIPAGAHVTNVAVVGRVSGTNRPVVCMIKNAISDGEVSFSMEDESEAAPEIQFTGHFSADDLDKEPWEIRNPRFLTFTLAYTAGTGGTIDGDDNQIVEEGDDGTPVTAVADSGFVFTGWSDGVTSATRQDVNVQDDVTAEAQFEEE